jgi:hypothetical protein
VSSVSSTNAVLANLLQTLSNTGSSVLSSPAELTALSKASPADLVKLSAAATQLESVDAIFGASDGSSDTVTDSSLTNLENLLTSSTGTSSPLSAAQLDTYQSAAQVQEAVDQSLTGNLVNVIA